MSRTKWEFVGSISVDAGCIRIGDPCYGEAANETELFCEGEDIVIVVPHDGDEEFKRGFGRAVVTSTGLGDGIYGVEIKREDNRVKELRIRFF